MHVADQTQSKYMHWQGALASLTLHVRDMKLSSCIEKKHCMCDEVNVACSLKSTE